MAETQSSNAIVIMRVECEAMDAPRIERMCRGAAPAFKEHPGFIEGHLHTAQSRTAFVYYMQWQSLEDYVDHMKSDVIDQALDELREVLLEGRATMTIEPYHVLESVAGAGFGPSNV